MEKYKKLVYPYVLFDLDGTLTDPGEGITNAAAYALQHFSIVPESKEELYRFIGPPLTETLEEFYGFSRENSLKAVEYFREYFSQKGIYQNRVIDGMASTLFRLKEEGILLYLATSKPTIFAKQIMDRFNLSPYFTFLGGGTLDGSRIEKKDIIAHVLENNPEINPAQTLMVGDRKHDIIGAKAHGIDGAGVLFGYGSEEELQKAGAKYLLQSMDELVDICCG